jgi:hypothetical protein
VLSDGLEAAGTLHEVGDLDGDGDLDVVSVAPSTAGDDGQAWCLTPEGEVIAHIRGTTGNMMGSHPHYFVDDEGEAWLVVADLNLYSRVPTQAYLYRVSELRGELTDADATRSGERLPRASAGGARRTGRHPTLRCSSS